MLRPSFIHASLIILFLYATPLSFAAKEWNLWPFLVGEEREEEAGFSQWQSIGPIFFERELPEVFLSGIRPFALSIRQKDSHRGQAHFLYPLANHYYDPLGTRTDFFRLFQHQSTARYQDEENVTSFVAFPFLFYRSSPQPEESHVAFFPVAGDMRNYLGMDRIRWLAFPFYLEVERNNRSRIHLPWPFIRWIRAEDARGFYLWPLLGQEERDDEFFRQFFIWPLVYNVRQDLWKEQPFEAFGVLPFYSRSLSDSAKSETYLWPFFGYTNSWDPEFKERRYFWPLFVQRRGESHYINRNAPFYSRSIRNGADRTWVMWPFFLHERRPQRDLIQEETRFLFFLYWSLRQSDPARPEADRAQRVHIWPLLSHWDNGAGRRQTQILSPFEVFFPDNDVVRAKYSPLFAFYQHDRDEVEDRSRRSFLFRLLTWEREAEDYRLNVGPLLTVEREEEAAGVEILKGLFSYRQDRGLRLFWLDFSRNNRQSDSE